MKKHTAVIIVDPQVGFCDPNGSLANAYGLDELVEIDRVMARIAGLEDREPRQFELILVMSEYQHGQHTDGDLDHPLAGLCVPGMNLDCQLCRHITQTAFDESFVKTDKSALASCEFRKWIDRSLRSGMNRFVICGVLLEHCVRETAIDLKNVLTSKDVEVVVCQDLVASRRVKYRDGELSTVEGSLRTLRRKGVRVQTWEELAVEQPRGTLRC